MIDENKYLDFILRKIDETRNYFLEEVKQGNLISKTHKSLFDFKLH